MWIHSKPVQVILSLVLAAGSCLWFASAGVRASEQSAELTRKHLYRGTLVAGQTELAAQVAADPGDREAQFGLGMLRFARAVEHLGQSLYRYGLTPPTRMSVPILRFPVPINPQPEAITYQGFRDLLKAFDDDLDAADSALRDVGGTRVAIVIDLARARLDLRGDGKPAEDESLAFILASLSGPPGAQPPTLASLEVKFDAGDAPWLAGYSHALMALCDFMLAHDFHATFDVVSHRFFPKSAGPLAQALSEHSMSSGNARGLIDADFADIIGLVHTINWPVLEPSRMLSARNHLKSVVAMSRRSWELILAETDDDREWIPNPRQTHVALGWRVRQEQIDAWMAALDEADAILDGRILVPHWRFARGFDIKMFFEAPQAFDLVMLATGPGAIPFLREGPITSQQRWNEITRSFEGNFFGYALWFN
jgi:hypothetical protein